MFLVATFQNKTMLALILLSGLLAAQALPTGQHRGSGKGFYATNPAYHGQFPYQAYITNDIGGIYGGTLISPQYVLTAAQDNSAANRWTVYLGSHRASALVEDGRLTEIVYEITIHELYSPLSLNHNIALLKFLYPITYTEFIQPARLPAYSQEHLTFGSEWATATGWGVGFSTVDEELHYTEERIYSTAECGLVSSYYSEYVICANSFSDAGICRTDRGGPLVLGHADNTTHLLVGIASYAYGGEYCSTISYPDIFTRITKYLAWIETKTNIPIEALTSYSNVFSII